jgi:outer membrane protein assembly factor BamB
LLFTVALCVASAHWSQAADEARTFRNNLNHTAFFASPVPPIANAVAWTYRLTASATGNGIYGSPAVADGRIYTTSGDGYLTCITLDGAFLWRSPTVNYHGMSSSPTVANGKVFVGCDSQPRMYAFDAITGAKVWEYVDVVQMFSIMSSPVVTSGRVYFATETKKVICLPENDPNGNGTISSVEVIWSRLLPDKIWSTPTVVDGRVYIRCGDGNNSGTNLFYCLNATNGAIVWSYPKSGNIGDIIGTAAISGTNLFFGATDGNVYCLNATDGGLVWKSAVGGGTWSSPALAYDRLYIGCNDSNLYCFAAATGTQLWRYTTGGAIWSSPSVASGRVYFGSRDNYLYCLDALAPTGALIWKLEIGAAHLYGIPGTPTLYQGNLLIGGWVGTNAVLYCIGPRDSDGDGLPNAWEAAFGLATNNANGDDGPDGDPDGDGLRNLAEYIAGTDPTNRASRVAFDAIDAAGDVVRLQWTGGTNARDRVERAASLGDGAEPWRAIYTNQLPTQGTGLLEDTNGMANGGVYRIGVSW